MKPLNSIPMVKSLKYEGTIFLLIQPLLDKNSSCHVFYKFVSSICCLNNNFVKKELSHNFKSLVFKHMLLI